MTDRVIHATESGGLVLPDGPVALFGAPSDAPLPVEAARVSVIQRNAAEYAAWQVRGLRVLTAPDGAFAAAIVTLTRARDRAEAWIAEANAAARGGLVVVDGAKTDGIESILKALRGLVDVRGVVSKAHGKCLWFAANPALDGWTHPAMAPNAEGDMVAPGVFSADGADPASRALAEALPPLKGRVADLGAGWGWLSREVLKREGVTDLHLVEADLPSLDCARTNIADPRAAFHWADATAWAPPQPLDAVVMNPPFHAGRKGDPRIGQTFISAAARMLAPHGQLWMVANRHLPYETTLAAAFREVGEVAGDARFKVLRAAKPTRPGR